MSTEAELLDGMRVEVENIGGIKATSAAFEPGVTLLVGRNATNRTSLLLGIMAACGSDHVSLKADADEGHVELTIDGQTYTRHLRRENDTIVTEGEPYLDDPEVADLFAFLLGTNEARQAVAQSAELRELVMRPVDTDAIQATIARLTAERTEVETELNDLDSLADRLATLEEKRDSLAAEIEAVQADLDETTAELEARERDPAATQEDEAELEDRMAKLRDKRATLESVEYNIETTHEVIEELRTERDALQADLDQLATPDEGRESDLEAEIEQLRDRKRSVESDIDEVQSVIQFNERMLEEQQATVVRALEGAGEAGGGGGDGGGSGPVTDALVEDEATTCWTCGSEVPVEAIQSTLDQLREVNQLRFNQIDEVESELSEYQERLNEIRTHRRDRRETERRLSELETKFDEQTAQADQLEAKREDLEAAIETLEAQVDELEDAVQSEVLDLHKEANELEVELNRLERKHEEVTDEIDTIEARLDEREALEERREDIQAEIEDQRTKIERLERQVIEEFNAHMDELLDRLEYENIERIWLERKHMETREGRRTVEKSVFELHVVRRSASGATFEDTLGHLSESEREVTGLVFALAGHLAHDVHEQLPVMVLDSLDPIDANRIETLVDYLTDVADYLVVALLEEDAAAFDGDVNRISDI